MTAEQEKIVNTNISALVKTRGIVKIIAYAGTVDSIRNRPILCLKKVPYLPTTPVNCKIKTVIFLKIMKIMREVMVRQEISQTFLQNSRLIPVIFFFF